MDNPDSKINEMPKKLSKEKSLLGNHKGKVIMSWDSGLCKVTNQKK